MAFPYKKFSNIVKLGSGGTEDVFSASVRSTSHRVVIKKLASDLREYGGNYKMFDQNVKTLRSLHHNNIIRVFDYGAYENAYYMSMEYVEGFDLEHLLHLPLFNRTIGLMVVFQALNGLAHAHKHGIFHCDIKPSNILVSNSGRAKLSDFGLAHVKEHLLHATPTGSVFTTPFYMPPEQAAAIAEQALDSDVWAETTTLAYKETPEQHARTLKEQFLYWDMWSVGVLLYRICTGRLPFFGKNLAQLANSIATLNPTSIHDLAPSISTDLSNAIESCLIKDPQKRLASLDPLIGSLQLYILSTGVHDFEATIKKHIRDCSAQLVNTAEQKAPEEIADEGAEAIKPVLPLSFLPANPWKTIGIAVSILIMLLAGALFFTHKSEKPSSTVDIASVHTEPAATTAPPITPANFTPAASDTAAERPASDAQEPGLSKIDSLIADVPEPEPASKETPVKKIRQKPIASVSSKKYSEMNHPKKTVAVQKPAEIAEKQNGILKISVEPSTAVISVDEVTVPTQEITAGMQLSMGQHTVTVTADGYVTFQQSLQIQAQSVLQLPIALKQKERGNGFIQVYTSPWSNIFIDGTMLGTTPTPSPISLAEGDHSLRLERDGFLPINQTVTIKNNEVTRLQIDLVQQDSTKHE